MCKINHKHAFVMYNPTPGRDAAEQEQKILQETEEHIPSDFSDATTEDDIDLSKLTPAQRRQYLAEKERRRKEREKRRREKYGDSYDEIMKKKNASSNSVSDNMNSNSFSSIFDNKNIDNNKNNNCYYNHT
ncbi:hypothetical protein MAR_010959 [Mya arenaria]|uniref:Uncharacterized protein n=1 Tax=Mya arenaria TaxID=6604 RepID=A0ABY7FSQ4_MYAAR|nr:hypothetical protein MAR_010959 [Mya arenaria]